MPIENHDFSADVVESEFIKFAYPLFKPVLLSANAREVKDKAERLIDVSELIIKYAAISAIGLYRRDGHNSNKIDASIQSIVKLPSIGKYTGVLREILNLYKDLKDPIADQLIDFYACKTEVEIVESIRKLAKTLQIKTTIKNTVSDLIGFLVTNRNKVAHGAAKHPDEVIAATDKISTLIMVLLDKVRFLGEAPLIAVEEKHEKAEGTAFSVTFWNGLIQKHDDSYQGEGIEQGLLYIAFSTQTEVVHIDVSPFLAVLECETCEIKEIALLNGAKKNSYDFLSYQCGHEIPLKPGHPQFSEIFNALAKFDLTDDEGGVPPHIRERLVENRDSTRLYQTAENHIDEGHIDNACEFLKDALEISPLYKKAAQKLVELQEKRGRINDALKVLDDYLDIDRIDVDMIVMKADLCLKKNDHKAAENQLLTLEHLQAEPEIIEHLKARIEVSKNVVLPDDETNHFYIATLFEYFLPPKTEFMSRMLLNPYLWVIVITAIPTAVFILNNDMIMGVTIISLGVTWTSILWATARIRKLHVVSKNNFFSFLKLNEDQYNSEYFEEMIRPIFGTYLDQDKERLPFRIIRRENSYRLWIVFLGGAVGTAWISLVTKYSATGLGVDVLYSAYCFLLFASLTYLLTCVYKSHSFLKGLQSKRIKFSMVQHPKFSIRYLSQLSRKLSVPLLVIYVTLTFSLYLGPFLANLAFIGAVTLLLIFTIYFYYSTILFVRSVISKSKWRLLDRFSTHFEEPFEQLIQKGRKKEYERVMELAAIRKFIDSIEVWAEKKSVLFFTSLMFMAILAFSTIGLSNFMTRTFVPVIARAVSDVAPRIEETEITALSNSDPTISVNINDVDDSMVVLWGTDVKGLQRALEALPDLSIKNNYQLMKQDFGIARVDWSNGDHGNTSLDIPFNTTARILVLGYNKVFVNLLPIMGGGKFSFDVEIDLFDQTILDEKGFIRQNDKGVLFLRYLEIEHSEKGASITTLSEKQVVNSEIGEISRDVEEYLESEGIKHTDLY